MGDRTDRDQHLVRATLDGDPAAFGELVTCYQQLVGGVAWRYGVRREDLEDVVNEVFIKTYRNLHRYRPEHPFSTWLYRLAANHVVDVGRRARKERGRVEMPEQLEDSRADVEDGLELRERQKLLRQALDELKPRYRDVLFLVYIEGHKVAQAAHLLGLPEGTVKTRLMRGRQALRELLVQRFPEYFGDDDALC